MSESVEEFIYETKGFPVKNSSTGTHVFVVDSKNCLYEYSIKQRKITYNFGRLYSESVYSIGAAYDKKSLFLSHRNKGFDQIDIASHKRIKFFETDKTIQHIHVTHDNRFFITVPNFGDSLTKWCMKTKQVVKTWSSNINKQVWEKPLSLQTWSNTIQCVYSLTSTYDSKYLLVGYKDGYLSICDLQNDRIVKTIKAMNHNIYSVAITKDNKYAYISDVTGSIKKLNIDTLEFTEDFKRIGRYTTNGICLANDDEILLVGSEKTVRVFDIEKREIVKEITIANRILKIILVNDNKNVLIAQENGDLAIIDVESLELIEESLLKDVTRQMSYLGIAVF